MQVLLVHNNTHVFKQFDTASEVLKHMKSTGIKGQAHHVLSDKLQLLADTRPQLEMADMSRRPL